MTYKQDVCAQLRTGPKTLRQIAKATGHDLGSVRNAKTYLIMEGLVRRVKRSAFLYTDKVSESFSAGRPDELFELTPIKAPPPQINRLTLPPYKPEKVMHRPVVDAPGCVVRRLLTGEVMA
jgi:hypothetical protein